MIIFEKLEKSTVITYRRIILKLIMKTYNPILGPF